MKDLGLEEKLRWLLWTKTRLTCDKEQVCPQCSVSVAWTLWYHPCPCHGSTPPHPQWSPESSNAQTFLPHFLFLSLHSISWNNLHFKRNQRLKMEGGWNFRHWWSERGRFGWNGKVDIGPCRWPLLVHCLHSWPEERTSRGQGRSDPMAPQSSSGSQWYLDRIYNSSLLTNLLFPSIFSTARYKGRLLNSAPT